MANTQTLEESDMLHGYVDFPLPVHELHQQGVRSPALLRATDSMSDSCDPGLDQT